MMPTNQQTADHLLSIWQASRELPPEERLEILMQNFFAPIPPCDVEYAAQLAAVSEAMAA
jgi:hypothetical protein